MDDRRLVADPGELVGAYADPRRDEWAVDTLPKLWAVAAEPGGRERLMGALGLSQRALRDVLAGRSRPRSRARLALLKLL